MRGSMGMSGEQKQTGEGNHCRTSYLHIRFYPVVKGQDALVCSYHGTKFKVLKLIVPQRDIEMHPGYAQALSINLRL